MRGRSAALAVCGLAAQVACHDRPVPAQATPSPAPARPAASPHAPGPLATAVPRVERDLLRYGGEAAASPPPMGENPPRALEPEPALPAASPAPVRLVGFVRQAGRLCASVVLGPEGLNVLCPDERVAGHLLVAVDEERGVRLVLPDGSQLDLPAPR